MHGLIRGAHVVQEGVSRAEIDARRGEEVIPPDVPPTAVVGMIGVHAGFIR